MKHEPGHAVVSRQRKWTSLDDDVLRQLHGNGRGARDIATFMVCAASTIHRRVRALGLQFNERHRWTPAEEASLRARYPDEPAIDIARDLALDIGQIHRHANRLGLHKSEAFMASDRAGRIRRGCTDPRMVAHQFKPGLVPANKGLRRPGYAPGRMAETQFKPGTRQGKANALYQPIGTERISKDGYLERKINDGRPFQSRWRAVHIVNWEAVHGPLPTGHCLTFRDGNKGNTALDNLDLITHAERMRRNTIHRYPPALKDAIRVAAKLKRTIRKHA